MKTNEIAGAEEGGTRPEFWYIVIVMLLIFTIVILCLKNSNLTDSNTFFIKQMMKESAKADMCENITVNQQDLLNKYKNDLVTFRRIRLHNNPDLIH